MTEIVAYSGATLPAGIRSRFVEDINVLTMHTLEAVHEGRNRPCVLLLHGFPKLAYVSWCATMECSRSMQNIATIARARRGRQ